MPLFKRSDEKKRTRRKSSTSSPTTTLPPPPQEKAPQLPQSVAQKAVTRQDLVFHAQLAHGSPTKKIKDFSNVKEMYARIGEAFKMRSSEILFCTLNTHKVDMARLLGGQIGLDDFLFVHVKGHTKDVQVVKIDVALGLTITDNGAGYAFIKRIKEGSVVDKHPDVNVGDHVEAIDGKNMVGCRHFEVAKLLKELPQHSEFTMRLVEPKKAFDAIGPRSTSRSGGQVKASATAAVAAAAAADNPQNGEPIASPEMEAAVGSGKTTLRLRSKGPATVETVEASSWEVQAAQKADDLLENFMGIRDFDLAQTLIDYGKDKRNVDAFACAVDEMLGDFEFPDEFLYDVWGVITDARPKSQ